MKITSIERQKKEGRYNIYIDGEFAFGLYRETIYNFGLRVNDEIDEKKIAGMRTYDEIGFGKKVAYRYLNYKPRSEKEVRDKLKEKKISSESIDKIITSLKELNYLNDEDYARLYVESKILHKPEGRRTLKMKLAGKGIRKEITEEIVEVKYTPATEEKKARELLNKYIKKVRAKSEIEKKQKCYRYLISRGFDFELVNTLLSSKD